jgi:hypothetical protein
MGNQVTNKLNPYLDMFLQDVSQGIFGNVKLTYTDIHKFSSKASPSDIKELEDYFWAWSTAIAHEEQVESAEFERFIKRVVE